MKRLFVFLFLQLLLAGARADETRAALPPPTRTVFAIIVTSNHGTSGARPDLHFADDDGVKYLEVFRMLAPAENVVLHTELDADTARLYPWSRTLVRPPTKTELQATIGDFTRRVGAVVHGGGAVDLYFVFAGHGDVDRGVGFLELRDSRFTSLDLESTLRTIGATRSHVLLDSCNSFFVVNARKPGGRPVATTADEARTLGERLPSVGVFLSTSSEAEVFEWSELQAGIFSHTVRSGLSGAADADNDGEVSYDELRIFVSVASAQIKNPRYRPKVFARGPGADAAAPMVRLSAGRGAILKVDGPQVRLTLRDVDEVPVVDLHKEQGAIVKIRLPERWASHAVVEERAVEEHPGVLGRFSLEGAGAEDVIAFAQLASAPASTSSRGTGDVFRMLFAVPFGPRAMAEAAPDVHKEDASAVYGVSDDDVERMRILLEQASGDGRGRRITIGAGYVTFGTLMGAAGGWLFTRDEEGPTKLHPYILLGYGGIMVGTGAMSLFGRSGEEALYGAYSLAIQSTDPMRRAKALAAAERYLFELRRSAHTRRIWLRVSSFGMAGVGAGLFAINEILATQKDEYCVTWSGSDGSSRTCTSTPSMSSDAVWGGRLIWGSIFALGTTEAVSSFVPYPVERLADVWESDPGRVHSEQAFRVDVSLAPIRGGGQLQLVGSF